MKKIIGMILVFSLIVSNYTIVLADVIWNGTDYSPTSGNETDVTASFTKNDATTIMVTIAWGDFKYKYADDLQWSTQKKAFEPVEGAGYNWVLKNGAGNDTVTITNNSNVKLYADIKYEAISNTKIEGNIQGIFYPNSDYTGLGYAGVSNIKIPTLTEDGVTADNIVLKRYLKISGKPTSVSADIVDDVTTVGTFTVTIKETGGYQAGGGGSN